MQQDSKASLLQAAKAFGVLGGVGFYFAIVMAICIFLGNLADENFGWGNAGKIIGILLGFPIAIYSIYRQLKK